MKIYLVRDLNHDYTNFFTTKKTAEEQFESDKENAALNPPDEYEIPVTKEGMSKAIQLGGLWGGGEVGFGG